jgi:RNA polymerase sigma factor (sigma-70 family)
MQKEKLFRKLIDENGRKIYRICCWYFDESEERNDAYQEALIRIWEHLHSFKGHSNISTWIHSLKN